MTINSVTKPTGWTCTQETKTVGSVTYPTIVCTTPSLAAGATVSITVNVTLASTTPANSQLRNVAYVCKAGDTPTVNCDPTCIVDPTNARCNPPPPPVDCNPMPGSPNYDPACVVTPPPSGPKCSSSISGALSAPISPTTPGLCDVGTMTGFTMALPVLPDTTIRYVWKCEKTSYPDVGCAASYNSNQPSGPQVSIKKYAGTLDGQDAT